MHAVLAQLDRVTGYEPVGRGFESLTPCQKSSRQSLGDFLMQVLGYEIPLAEQSKIANAKNELEKPRACLAGSFSFRYVIQ